MRRHLSTSDDDPSELRTFRFPIANKTFLSASSSIPHFFSCPSVAPPKAVSDAKPAGSSFLVQASASFIVRPDEVRTVRKSATGELLLEEDFENVAHELPAFGGILESSSCADSCSSSMESARCERSCELGVCRPLAGRAGRVERADPPESISGGSVLPFFSLQTPSIMSSDPALQAKVDAKIRRQGEAIPPAWRLASDFTSHPSGADVSSITERCGILSKKELEIISIREPGALSDAIRSKRYKVVEVTEAYCKSAAIAHQLASHFASAFLYTNLMTPRACRPTALPRYSSTRLSRGQKRWTASSKRRERSQDLCSGYPSR